MEKFYLGIMADCSTSSRKITVLLPNCLKTMVAYFCPLHASYFSTDYVNMQDTYVNMQDKYVNMQDNYVNLLDKNKKQFIYVSM